MMRVRLIAGIVVTVMSLQFVGFAIDSKNAAYFGEL